MLITNNSTDKYISHNTVDSSQETSPLTGSSLKLCASLAVALVCTLGKSVLQHTIGEIRTADLQRKVKLVTDTYKEEGIRRSASVALQSYQGIEEVRGVPLRES